MKKTLIFAAIAILGLAAFSGCKKSSGSSYTMSATVGNSNFNVNSCTASLSGTSMAIVGYSGSASGTPPYLTITIDSFAGAATYTIDTTASFPAVSGSYWPDANLSDIKVVHTGSVVITASSTTSLSGTFNFKTDDGTSISSGKFTAKRL